MDLLCLVGLELELGGVGLRAARGVACEEVARVVLRAFVVPFALESIGDQGSEWRIQGSGYRVQGAGCRTCCAPSICRPISSEK